MTEKTVCVIGGGLAGCEAAWQLARLGINVRLYEMRPVKETGAHHTDRLSELVCSNSLGSYHANTASALLKEELRTLGSLIIDTAWRCRVPAGSALAVDRALFAEAITEAIHNEPLISVKKREIEKLPLDGVTIVATGPLTSPSLTNSIAQKTGKASLHFFDAAAPILTRESVDSNITYEKARYDKGDGVYINCPMNREQYEKFWQALVDAERVPLKDFETNTPYFESCLPVEVIASRGIETLRFGPLKPVGLENPHNNELPYAVVQLRQDNAAADLYNIVGFQTNLKWPEQKRIFSMIPGLEKAEFVRLGVMHRNTFLNSPEILSRFLNLRGRPSLFFAGQLTGVEGYSESTAMGLVAAWNAANVLKGRAPIAFPTNTMIGALIRYITTCEPKHFQPMNSTWELLDMHKKVRRFPRDLKRERLREIALNSIADVKAAQFELAKT